MSQIPVLKRVTLWVRNLDRSIAFYRDVIGLEILEQKDLRGPGIAGLVGYEDGRLRIVHLGTPGSTSGWVGLYELTEARPAVESVPPAPQAHRVSYGQATAVFESNEIDAVVARLRASGAPLLKEPSEYPIPPRGGSPGGTLVEVIVFDPDGVLVSVMGMRSAG
jgi:lactoylglutathione lyase